MGGGQKFPLNILEVIVTVFKNVKKSNLCATIDGYKPNYVNITLLPT